MAITNNDHLLCVGWSGVPVNSVSRINDDDSWLDDIGLANRCRRLLRTPRITSYWPSARKALSMPSWYKQSTSKHETASRNTNVEWTEWSFNSRPSKEFCSSMALHAASNQINLEGICIASYAVEHLSFVMFIKTAPDRFVEGIATQRDVPKCSGCHKQSVSKT